MWGDGVSWRVTLLVSALCHELSLSLGEVSTLVSKELLLLLDLELEEVCMDIRCFLKEPLDGLCG